MDSPVQFNLKEMIHPMAARNKPNFVANSLGLQQPIFLITGPNMGGKSTFLRMVCIAVVMAQMGSYVPAEAFEFTAVDRVFTRIGAADRIMEGKSTFFVEMEETYNIVSQATKNSLVIIDELGRGTSTYDGVSIAYATLKYISEKINCITLFATHYHFLIEEFSVYQNIRNYYMESEFDEKNDEIKFNYKFVPGKADKSHGIVMGKMAGLPEDVLKSAKEKEKFMTTEKRNIGFEKNLMEKFSKAITELSKIEKDEKEVNFNQLLHELELLI
jgi:DNA mismatch repair protein MSH6